MGSGARASFAASFTLHCSSDDVRNLNLGVHTCLFDARTVTYSACLFFILFFFHQSVLEINGTLRDSYSCAYWRFIFRLSHLRGGLLQHLLQHEG